MPNKLFCMVLVGFALCGQARAQQVFVGGDDAQSSAKKLAPAQQTPPTQNTAKETTRTSVVSESATKSRSVAKSDSVESPKAQSSPKISMIIRATSTPPPNAKASARVELSPTKTVAKAPPPARTPGTMPDPRTMRLTKVEGPAPEANADLPIESRDSAGRSLKPPLETAFVRLADGFDFPVGKPEAQGYYKARGFRSNGHLGEDWDGIRGGDTDLGDPIYCIGAGIVVFARDCHMGWGNVVIVRHSYRDGGTVRSVDSLYGHCDRLLVRTGQIVSRGQQIATIGTAHGLYDAHLHLEVRKNIEIGMSRAKFARDSSNYFDPTQFINSHRHLQGGGGSYRVAMNTFVQDARINWAAVRNYSHSHHRGGTRESATALKKAVAATKN
jgi:murein DD-endopeptidase MepM/ murein hydrolase activator NlpD